MTDVDRHGQPGLSFDDPKPPSDKRRAQLIFLRPSLKQQIDRLRGRQSRSDWIERAIRAALKNLAR